MGFLSDLKDRFMSSRSTVIKDALKKRAEKQLNTSGTKKENLAAIKPGRMNQTDQVKGKESPLPEKPGVYRHVNKETKKIEYVGQTDNIRKRQQEHARSGKLNTDKQNIQYAEAKANAGNTDLQQTEKNHIKRHKPAGNKYEGGNGRTPSRKKK